MCALSFVMEQWSPWVPQPAQQWPSQIGWTEPQPQVAEDATNEYVREMLDSLEKAMEAARKLDELTGQPDCVDPDKAKLLNRVEELERRLQQIEESRES